MQENNQQPPKEFLIFNLDIHLWHGRKKAFADEVGLDLDKFDQRLHTLGHKRTFDPSRLKSFEAFKKRMERTAGEKYGIPTSMGYLVPPTLAVKCAQELDKVVVEARKAIKDLIAEWETVQEEWIKQFPDQEESLRAAATPKERVEAQLHFGYQAFKASAIEETDPHSTSVLQQGFLTARDGLFGQLLRSASKVAKQVLESLKGERVDSRTVSPFRTLVEKLKAMSFLDKRVKPLHEAIQDALNDLPAIGSYPPEIIGQLERFVRILADHDLVCRKLDAGEKLLPDAIRAANDVDPVRVSRPAAGKASRPAASAPKPVQNQLVI